MRRPAISGSVWNDTDGNGARDAAETGIAGVTVSLIDANGSVNTDVQRPPMAATPS